MANVAWVGWLLVITVACSSTGGDDFGSAIGGAAGLGTGGAGAAASGGGGAAGGAGAAGASGWFSDAFDSQHPAWVFDMTDPVATYTYDQGSLRITGGSPQAFAWFPVDAAWGDDYEVEITFAIESGIVGGVVVRGEDQSAVNALNCNLRVDLSQLRAARHLNRNYFTLNSVPTSVENGVTYTISARVKGDTLTCTQQSGGPTVSTSGIPFKTGKIGLFVYNGTVRFDAFTVRP